MPAACRSGTRGIDGWAVSLVGVESQPRPTGSGWEAAGTLYPMGARKLARALNHASGRRPAVVLANLAGFDGSRGSLEAGQLEHGAELARAVVNFRGPLVVVVIGRFHGGAYVVLSQRLNPWVRIVALEGTRVSVIGGSAAAEVVLHREVDAHMERLGAGDAGRGPETPTRVRGGGGGGGRPLRSPPRRAPCRANGCRRSRHHPGAAPTHGRPAGRSGAAAGGAQPVGPPNATARRYERSARLSSRTVARCGRSSCTEKCSSE